MPQTLLLFADLFNLLNPFAYSRYNFPPRLHLNNTNPVYICQLWDFPIFMNIIEHIPAVRRWCQGGCKNKESHLEAHFPQPRLFSSETEASQREPEFDASLLGPHSCLSFILFRLFLWISSHFHHRQTYAFSSSMVWLVLMCDTISTSIRFINLVSRVLQHSSILILSVSVSFCLLHCKWVRFINQWTTFNTSSAVMRESIHQRD